MKELFLSNSNTDFHPIGGAIRNWSNTGDVFLYLEGYDNTLNVPQDWTTDGAQNLTELQWWSCSIGDGCATQTDRLGDGEVDINVYGGHYQHPTLALRRVSGGPRELRLLGDTLLVDDCDADGDLITEGDLEDDYRADSYARNWSTSTGFGALRFPENGTSGCSNVGVTLGRFDYVTNYAHACYTFDADNNDPAVFDIVRCNNEEGAVVNGPWVNPEQVSTVIGAAEDHPGWDFYGNTNFRAVASVDRSVLGNQILVHFPDEVAAPFVTFTSAAPLSRDVDHPSLYQGNDRLFLVWAESGGTDDELARVLYQTCFLSDGCTNPASWLATPQVLADSVTGSNRGARHPEIVVDGDRRFTLYQYDSKPGAMLTQARVAMAYTCGWSGLPIGRQLIRTPDSDEDNQVIGVGSPNIVLNKPEQIVHVVFAELEDIVAPTYSATWSESASEEGQAFWAWEAYPACP